MRFRLLPLIGFLIFISFGLFAQPGGGGPCPTPPCSPPVPISGLEYLLVGGVLFGIRHVFKKQK
jgi:hypothetical protein